MACKTETKTINDVDYSVTQWPADKAMLMQFKLLKVFGPSLTQLATAVSTTSKSIDSTKLAESLNQLFVSATPEDIFALLKECILGVARDGSRLTENSFKEIFGPDDLLEIYQVFLFVLKVNYGNFIKGQLVENLLAKVNL